MLWNLERDRIQWKHQKHESATICGARRAFFSRYEGKTIRRSRAALTPRARRPGNCRNCRRPRIRPGPAKHADRRWRRYCARIVRIWVRSPYAGKPRQCSADPFARRGDCEFHGPIEHCRSRRSWRPPVWKGFKLPLISAVYTHFRIFARVRRNFFFGTAPLRKSRVILMNIECAERDSSGGASA